MAAIKSERCKGGRRRICQVAPKPIEEMDGMVQMLQQKEVLDATGNSPDNVMRKEDEGDELQGEVILQIFEIAESLNDDGEREEEDAGKEQ